MKKFIFSFLALFTCMTVNAQSWKEETIEGDELLGTKTQAAYVFQDGENGKTFIMFENETEDFNLCVSSAVFDFNGGGASGGKIVRGLVGLYDENGKLIKKYDKYCFESIGSFYDKVHSNKYTNMGGNNKKNAKNIIEYLKNAKGSVRFVIPLYQSFQFDFTVPCMKNEN